MKFEFEGKMYYIDGLLAQNLDSIIYNIKNDWDFVIVITGDRTVRVGKSVLGFTVGAYLSAHMAKVGIKRPFTAKQIFFDSKVMVEYGLKAKPHSILQYDEGREGLASNKFAKEFQQDLLDFFAECGQLNHIFIIVLPDFFELSESIAVPRSEILLNVYRKPETGMINLYGDGARAVVKFKRGQFEFFNRSKKQRLYERAKVLKRKNYGLIKANFVGRFTNQWPIDEDEYLKAKRDSLSRFQDRQAKNKEQRAQRKQMTVKQQKLLYSLIESADNKEVRRLCEHAGMNPNYGTTILRDWGTRLGLAQKGAGD